MALKSLDEILAGEVIKPEEERLLPRTENIGYTHLPVVILLDTSASMSNGNAIGRVSDAIKGFLSSITDPNADEFHRKLRRQGDFCIISYGGDVKTIVNWTPGNDLARVSNLKIAASGNTPMGAAIIQSADLLLNRYRGYKVSGTRAFCGLVFNLTDGAPTDMDPNGEATQKATWHKAQERVALFEQMGSKRNPYAQFIHFATDRGACETLNQFSGERLLFMPTNSEETTMARVNFLEGADSFSKFVRFIEMSLNSIMSAER
jgi:uncharacterized protein YegL